MIFSVIICMFISHKLFVCYVSYSFIDAISVSSVIFTSQVSLAPFQAVSSQLEVVIDVSGSMSGVPQATACYIAHLLIEAIGLHRVTIFADEAQHVAITAADMPSRHAELYRGVTSMDGSTTLRAAFDILRYAHAFFFQS
jgi:hypothetical protein